MLQRTVIGPMLAIALAALAVAPAPAAAREIDVEVDEWIPDEEAWCEIQAEWRRGFEAFAATDPADDEAWYPLMLSLDDAQLASLNLPSVELLRAHTFDKPTMVLADGTLVEVELPSVNAVTGPPLANFAGNSCIGIRPGAWLLLPDEENGVPLPQAVAGPLNWPRVQMCTAGHVFGAPGSYKLSTAGHCGRVGDRAVTIAAVGNHGGVASPILLDIGRFSVSHNSGAGNDWGMIDILPQNQALTTPTMCFWGGPTGVFTKTGSTVAINYRRNNLLDPQPSLNADPLLIQGIVHYGHGVGMGVTGTPRAHVDYAWLNGLFIFWGPIAGGDSGSAANTVGGDSLGGTREAAGVITHLWAKHTIDGHGLMGGTRTTAMSGTVANGQLLPYPYPIPFAP